MQYVRDKVYNDLKKELLEYLEAMSQEDIKKIKSESFIKLNWDYILIDEAQDWPTSERDLFYKLYGHKSLIIADGIDQNIRNNVPGWLEQNKEERQMLIIELV